MKIIGIDPGTTRVGYGIIQKEGHQLTHIESGILSVKEKGDGERLVEIERELAKLFLRFPPDRVGIEKLFFTKNKKTAVTVAQARGVILAAAKKLGVPVREISPSEVKLASTGNGSATKEAVARMVRLTLGISDKKIFDDVTDALAIAIAASSRRIDF